MNTCNIVGNDAHSDLGDSEEFISNGKTDKHTRFVSGGRFRKRF